MSGTVIFKYGTMFCGKSMDLIGNYENLRYGGKAVAVYKPAYDTREDDFVIKSRSHALSLQATPLEPDTHPPMPDEDYVFIDEGQFMTAHNADWLEVLKLAGKTVIVWGLLRDYRGKVFDGTVALLAHADSLVEMKTVCNHPGCMKKATHHVLSIDGVVQTGGSGLHVGDMEFQVVCAIHYHESTRNPVTNQ